FRSIGETGGPEAIEFLTNRGRSELGSDAPHYLVDAAAIALKVAMLSRMTDDGTRREVLIAIVREDGRGAVKLWAANQLCDDGITSAIPVIQHFMTETWSGQYGVNEVQFCQRRMAAVSRDQNRISALGSVLDVEHYSDDDRLIRWAINQLAALRVPAADR